MPVDRVGLYVPGGARRLPEQRRHERRPGPGSPGSARWPSPARRSATTPASFAGYPQPDRSSRPAPCSASTRCTPSAAPRRSRCSPTAPARRRRRSPATARSSATRSTWSPARATSTSSPPSGCSRASSASTPRPGPTEIADPRRRHRRPRPRRRRPRQPGRARPARGLGPRHRQRAARRRGRSRRWSRRVAATKHPERVRTRPDGTQSGIVLVDDVDAGLDVVNAYAAEHLEIQTRDAAAVAARVRNAGAVFVGPYCPGQPRRLRRRAPTTCCPPAAAPATAAACRCSRSCAASTSSTYDEAALRDVARHVVTLAEAEDLPAHGEAVHRPLRRRASS